MRPRRTVLGRDPALLLRGANRHYGGGGTYTETDRPCRLEFTWLWDGNDTRQLIELDFEEADGITTVRFTLSGLWDELAVRSHEDGWGKAFENLRRLLEAAPAGDAG